MSAWLSVISIVERRRCYEKLELVRQHELHRHFPASRPDRCARRFGRALQHDDFIMIVENRDETAGVVDANEAERRRGAQVNDLNRRLRLSAIVNEDERTRGEHSEPR
jgi:hypothetical protein